MAAVRHLGFFFLKYNFQLGRVRTADVHCCAKFRHNSLNGCADTAIFARPASSPLALSNYDTRPMNTLHSSTWAFINRLISVFSRVSGLQSAPLTDKHANNKLQKLHNLSENIRQF